MKIASFALAGILLAGCSPSGKPPEASSPSTAKAPVPADAATAAALADIKALPARGVIEAVDIPGRTLTIAHGPIESLGLPAMSTTFEAPGMDLSQFRPGQAVGFQFKNLTIDRNVLTKLEATGQ